MTGATSGSGHDGFRSELLAQLVFASWGTSHQTSASQDYGIDLHCTLTERVGKRAWVKSPYTVQVKSNMRPWRFKGVRSVQWLIEHPLPLFLSVVDRTEHRVLAYRTSPRFHVWSLFELPDRLVLKPSRATVGDANLWQGGTTYSLGAPIIDLSIDQLLDADLMQRARAALEWWIDVENKNLDFQRAGVLKFELPDRYEPNTVRRAGRIMQWNSYPTADQLGKALTHLTKMVGCLGNQLNTLGDQLGAVRMALLYEYIVQTYPQFFDQSHGRDTEFMRLYQQLSSLMGRPSLFQGIDELQESLRIQIPEFPRDPP